MLSVDTEFLDLFAKSLVVTLISNAIEHTVFDWKNLPQIISSLAIKLLARIPSSRKSLGAADSPHQVAVDFLNFEVIVEALSLLLRQNTVLIVSVDV